MKLFSAPIPKSTEIEIDGRAVDVAVRVHARARSYRLSLPSSGVPVLTMPPNGRWSEAHAFLERHRHWLATRLARSPVREPLGPGSSIALRGVPHLIMPTGKLRGTIETGHSETGPTLLVPGDAAHVARRTIDWMKRQAQIDLARQSAIHATTLDVTISAISLRSQSTRWGSCSARGALSYNWRLIAAPPHVLDYVAAHEVAHLVEMNHSPAFWATVRRALPDYERGKAWLKAHGRELMGVGLGI